MKQRLLFGLIALPPVLAALWLGGLWWSLLVLAVSGIGGLEYFALMRRGGYESDPVLGQIWLWFLVLSFWFPQLLPLTLILTVGFIGLLIRALFTRRQPILFWAITLAGPAYIGIALGQALALRLIDDGAWWLFLGLALPMFNDTFAYFVGVTVGKRKIWPRHSPKKSWEGTIGGWVFATLAGLIFGMASPLPFGPFAGALIGLGGGILAFFGDLSISLIKRQVGAKDSGRFMPGHGGMLDRLDSLLFVLPYVYQISQLLTR